MDGQGVYEIRDRLAQGDFKSLSSIALTPRSVAGFAGNNLIDVGDMAVLR